MIFVLVYFRALKRKPVICKSDNAFRFSRFLVPSRQRNHRKSFNCHGKYFANENFRAPAWTSAKCYCGNKTANHSAGFGSSYPLAELAIYYLIKFLHAIVNKSAHKVILLKQNFNSMKIFSLVKSI